MSIHSNIVDRQAAADLFAFVASESNEPRSEHFWRCFAELIDAAIPKPVQVPANVDDAKVVERRLIASIEATPMAFGKYSGVLVRDVPTDYLCWLVDANKNDFNQQLAEYVKTSHFKAKQDRGL